jgi:DNA-binding MarR family transcriptional regulator
LNTLAQAPAETPASVAENDLKVLEAIARFSSISQRVLAEHAGLSLGMVNLVLKRLVGTGYVQIQLLDKHKVRYLLTPAGIAAKYRRAHEYLSRTVRIYEIYRQAINRIINEQLDKGFHKFVIYGEGDIIGLMKLVLSEQVVPVEYRICAPSAEVRTLEDEIPLICYLPHKSPLVGISVLESVLGATPL